MHTQSTYEQYQLYIDQHSSGWQLQEKKQQQMLANQHSTGIQAQLQINQFDSGIYLSRMTGKGHGTYASQLEGFHHQLSFFILLSGANQVNLSKQQQLQVSHHEIWLLQGTCDQANEVIHSEYGHFSGIHLDFSQEKLARWQEDGLLPSGLLSSAYFQAKNFSTASIPLQLKLKKMLSHPLGVHDLSLLELESDTLTLVKSLFSQVFPLKQKTVPTNQHQINEVLDIIHAEFHCPLTIAQLARRVGTNECYLKRDFKIQTGQTIANYIRKLRLDTALTLLEQGKSIQETMYFVGFHHQGHFCELFKKHFGYAANQINNNKI